MPQEFDLEWMRKRREERIANFRSRVQGNSETPGFFSNLWQSIKDFFKKIWDKIVDLFSEEEDPVASYKETIDTLSKHMKTYIQSEKPLRCKPGDSCDQAFIDKHNAALSLYDCLNPNGFIHGRPIQLDDDRKLYHQQNIWMRQIRQLRRGKVAVEDEQARRVTNWVKEHPPHATKYEADDLNNHRGIGRLFKIFGLDTYTWKLVKRAEALEDEIAKNENTQSRLLRNGLS